jgi:hypothetical protein
LNDQILPTTSTTTNSMQEIKKSQGLDLLQTVANRETPK